MLFAALYAFFQEHQCCGDLDGGVEGDRVWLLLMLVLAALKQSPNVSGQTGSKYRLGWVAVHPQPPNPWPVFERFKARPAERGYVEGKITFDMRWAGSDYSRTPQLVAEL